MQQWDYVAKVTPITVPAVRCKCKDAPLTPQERSQYPSVTQQLSWPARTTMPGLCYRVSELQQEAKKATLADLLQVNAALKVAQQVACDGVCLLFRKPPTDLGELMIVAAHDASFANQPEHGSQQGLMVRLGPRRALDDPKEFPVMVLDWSSSVIHRVVGSTLAAEAASASTARDRLPWSGRHCRRRCTARMEPRGPRRARRCLMPC